MKLLIAVALLLVADYAVPESPDDLPVFPGTCHERLNHCVIPIHNNNYTIQSFLKYSVYYFHYIDSVCGVFQEAQRCMTPYLDSCGNSTRRQLNAAISIISFVCSDEGKALVRDLENSQCYGYAYRLREIYWSSKRCADDNGLQYTFSRTLICGFTDRVINCTARRTTDNCGQAAGKLFEGVIHQLLVIYRDNMCYPYGRYK